MLSPPVTQNRRAPERTKSTACLQVLSSFKPKANLRSGSQNLDLVLLNPVLQGVDGFKMDSQRCEWEL